MTTQPWPVGQYGPQGIPEPLLTQIGDITVSQSWVVTPRGTVPLAGTEWWVTHRAGYVERIPVWAIVLAVVFFPLGLLFLLVKESRLEGFVDVGVRSAAFAHVTVLPADSQAGREAPVQVEYVRSLVQRATPAAAD